MPRANGRRNPGPPKAPRETHASEGLWKVSPPWKPTAKPVRFHRGLEAFGFHTSRNPDGGFTYKPLTRGVGPFYSIGVGSFYVVGTACEPLPDGGNGRDQVIQNPVCQFHGEHWKRSMYSGAFRPRLMESSVAERSRADRCCSETHAARRHVRWKLRRVEFHRQSRRPWRIVGHLQNPSRILRGLEQAKSYSPCKR